MRSNVKPHSFKKCHKFDRLWDARNVDSSRSVRVCENSLIQLSN